MRNRKERTEKTQTNRLPPGGIRPDLSPQKRGLSRRKACLLRPLGLQPFTARLRRLAPSPTVGKSVSKGGGFVPSWLFQCQNAQKRPTRRFHDLGQRSARAKARKPRLARFMKPVFTHSQRLATIHHHRPRPTAWPSCHRLRLA